MSETRSVRFHTSALRLALSVIQATRCGHPNETSEIATHRVVVPGRATKRRSHPVLRVS